MNENQNILEQIKNFNLEDGLSYEKLLLFIELNKINLPTLVQRIPKGTIVFRSRENFDISSFNHFKDLGCPPKEKVIKFNRANRPFQSVFYCSDKRETSYSEFMDEWKEYPIGEVFNITIAAWELLRDIHVHLLIDRKTISDNLDLIKGEQWTKEEIEIYDFLVQMFEKSAFNNDSIYILTSAVSNSLLMKSELDGIMFPCVPTNGNGLNIVLKSDICEKYEIKIKFIVRDTFLTVKKENNLKADHLNIASIEGKLNNSDNSIIWEYNGR